MSFSFEKFVEKCGPSGISGGNVMARKSLSLERSIYFEVIANKHMGIKHQYDQSSAQILLANLLKAKSVPVAMGSSLQKLQFLRGYNLF